MVVRPGGVAWRLEGGRLETREVVEVEGIWEIEEIDESEGEGNLSETGLSHLSEASKLQQN